VLERIGLVPVKEPGDPFQDLFRGGRFQGGDIFAAQQIVDDGRQGLFNVVNIHAGTSSSWDFGLV